MQMTVNLFKEQFRQGNLFLERIPYHYDIGSVLSNLTGYIRNKTQRIDERLFVLFDYPGMGKTTTIVNAAQETNSLYVQVSLTGSAVITSIEHTVQQQMAQHRLFSENQLLSVIQSTCWAALVKIFESVYRSIQMDPTASIVLVKDNGISKANAASIQDVFTSQINSIIDVSGKQVIVLHFDDCQYWGTPATFTRQVDRDALSLISSDIKNYYMIGLSIVLARLPQKVFVALTGTNIGVLNRIRIYSGIKLYQETSLQYSTAQILLNILKHFCNVTIQHEQILAELKQLTGPFRIFYYFLRLLHERHNNDTAETLTIPVLRTLIETTYSMWEKNDLFSQLFNNSLSYENSLKEILFTALYPQFFLGESVLYDHETNKITEYHEGPISNSLVCVAKFAANRFPDKWMKYHDIGLVRWRVIGNDYIMEPPFPFLIRLWCDQSALSIFPSVDVEQLKSYLSVGILATGVMGHAFQFAVALELTLPYSPLFKRILPNGYVPLAQEYKWETFTVDSVPDTPSATIFYANDQLKPVKDYDIITFIRDNNGNPQKAVIQVKSDTNSTRCMNSASKLFRLGADVKVMVSWHEHKLASLASDKCIVIAGPAAFIGTAFPFQFIFGNISQFTDYREITQQLTGHPFFQKFLDSSIETTPKKRKYDHFPNTCSSQSEVSIKVRKYEKKKGSITVYVPQNVNLDQLLKIVCHELKEEDGDRVSLRTADEFETKLREDLADLIPDKLYHALTEEQEDEY